MSNDLKNLSFFSGINQERLEQLSECSTLRQFKEGHVILRRGKIATGFYVVLSGHVGIEEITTHHDSLNLQTISHGDVLGWSWMPPFRQWHFNAVALDDVSALWFEDEHIEDLFDEDPELGRELMRRLLDTLMIRIESLRNQIENWYQPAPVV